MPDSDHSHPDDPNKSGAHKLVMQKPAGKPVTTKIDINEGTREHSIEVQQLQAEQTAGSEHSGQNERRRQPAQTQVNFQPGSGGLTGWPAMLAQMTFATAFLFAFFLIYRDGRADLREYMAQAREDRLADRSQDQSSNAAILGAVTSLGGQIAARDAKLETAIEEARLSRAESRLVQAEQKQLNQEILAVLRSIRDKGEMEPEAMAPMPRMKANGAG